MYTHTFKQKLHLYLTGLLLLIFPINLFSKPYSAEDGKLSFSSLTSSNGLSNNTVLDIAQDSLGFIWIGTADGLNRFDGENFVKFTFSENDSNSIGGSGVYKVLPTEKELLLGTSEGFSTFDLVKSKFKNYTLDHEVIDITRKSVSSYFFISGSTIYEYVASKREIKEEFKSDYLDFTSIVVYDDFILLGTHNGLYKYSVKNKNIEKYINELSNKNIQTLLVDNDSLWVATEGNGLYKVVNSKVIVNYRECNNKEVNLSSNYVRSLSKDNEGSLWVGTFVGLNIIHKDGTISKIYYDKNTVNTLNQNSVRSLFCDNQGGIWIGTYFGGVNYYHSLIKRFYHINNSNDNSLSDDIITTIQEDDLNRDILWVGTNDGGLNRYSLSTKRNIVYKADRNAKNSLQSNNIKAIHPDGNTCFIGTHGGGLSILDKKTGYVKTYTPENSVLPSFNVYDLKRDNMNRLWIATLKGLMYYDYSVKEFKSIKELVPWGETEVLDTLVKTKVFCLLLDSRQRLWIGTEDGIFLYSIEKNLLTKYDLESPIKRKKINCFFEDSSFQVWVGTTFGLFKINESKQKIESIGNLCDKSNSNVSSITQDKLSRIWVGTNKGLICYDVRSNTLKNYTHKDGLLSEQFTPNVTLTLRNGKLFFGTLKGIVYFNPLDIVDNPFAPKPVISSLKVFSNLILPGDETGILSKDISITSKVSLPPEMNSFTLNLSVPNYLSMNHNFYAYKIIGLHDDWVPLDGNSLSYANLKSGEYKLRFIASNSEGKWSEASGELVIIVQPYWWQTIYFKLFVVLAVVFLILYLFKMHSNKQEIKNKLEIEVLKQQQKDEINQMKLRFFINISHEFKTPLTLIISPLEELLNSVSDKQNQEQLKYIKRNANRLLFLVNQLLDFRQTELGVFVLKVHSDFINEAINSITAPFKNVALKKNINFSLETSYNETDKALFDPSYIDLILSNLLSNSFKFTPEGGVVKVKWEKVLDNLVISVSDSGCGIQEKDINKIFQRFYQLNHEVKGTGIGLAIVKNLVDSHHGQIDVTSTVGKGTEFSISIPQNSCAYADSEKVGKDEAIKSLNIQSGIADNLFDNLESNREKSVTEYMEGYDTILVVEDDLEVRNYLVSSFTGNYNILVADNGADALKTINEEEVDLLISDVMLPEMDGYKLCKSVKQNIKTSHIPILLLTAKTSEEDQLEGLTCGADDYITKPFNLSSLRLKINNRLMQKRRILEHYSETLEINPENLAANSLDKEFLEKAKAIIEENLDNVDFKVDDFCLLMAMSRSNLHLKMKAITGGSTIEFIKKIRFNKACQLLLEKRYSINEISSMVGFNTPSYFTTSFKKYFGMLPTDYIKKNSR